MKLIIFIIILFNSMIGNSFAYLDPGSGGFILQAIIGFIAAIFASLTFYWNKFKSLLSKIFKKEKKENDKE
jgi:Mg2+/Co2+ transporter CorB